MKVRGLCFRCEHRACFYENGYAPRYQCGDTSMNVVSCYMYLPVKPVICKKSDKSDIRPEFGGYFGCRMFGIDVVDEEVELVCERGEKGVFITWCPKMNKKGGQDDNINKA
jgi:hypothetical protein